jgi:hypothetical protein
MPRGCLCEPALAPALAKRGERGERSDPGLPHRGRRSNPPSNPGKGECPTPEPALSIAKGSFAITAGVFLSSLLGKIHPNILLECAKEYIGAGVPFEDAASGLKAIHPGSKLPPPQAVDFQCRAWKVRHCPFRVIISSSKIQISLRLTRRDLFFHFSPFASDHHKSLYPCYPCRGSIPIPSLPILFSTENTELHGEKPE